MPAIKRTNVVTTEDALLGLKFKVLQRPALVSLFASGVTATDKISLSVGGTTVLDLANPNVESAADVIDTTRDGVLFNERVPPGELFMPITATTAVNFLLVIDEV